jgi:hypothetical protein
MTDYDAIDFVRGDELVTDRYPSGNEPDDSLNLQMYMPPLTPMTWPVM